MCPLLPRSTVYKKTLILKVLLNFLIRLPHSQPIVPSSRTRVRSNDSRLVVVGGADNTDEVSNQLKGHYYYKLFLIHGRQDINLFQISYSKSVRHILKET